MVELPKICHEFENNICKLKIPKGKKIKNFKSCDIFLSDWEIVFYVDSCAFRFKSERCFDVKDIKNLDVTFDSQLGQFSCALPCYPEELKGDAIKADPEKGSLEKKDERVESMDILKLRRITDSCVLSVDGEQSKFEQKYGYGFGCQFREDTSREEDTLERICRLCNPYRTSPFSRTIQREKDELKDFCRDQYKLNFVELQVPEGHENPMKFTINFDDHVLTKDEEALLHNLTAKKVELADENHSLLDCGLVCLLMSTCYDVRSTLNEATCVSPWTRTILSSTLSYFEVFENLRGVVEAFMRRSLIYPLYRNYDFSRLCAEDTIDALQKGKKWIQKQLLLTHDLFQHSDDSRELLNKYYIEDYLRYVTNSIDDEHLHMLSRNLKNVLLDVTKKHLRLGLGKIETELLKELIEDIRFSQSSDSDEFVDVGEDSEETDSCEDGGEDESTTSDEDDNNSVIENKA